MYSKIFATLTICALIQGSCGETIDDVIAEVRPKIESLRSQIGEKIDNGGLQIKLARSEIGKAASQAESTLGIKRSELGALVEQVKIEAATQGKNIQNCLDAYNTAIRQVNFRGLQECRTNPDLDLVGIKLGRLGEIKDILSKSIDLCVATNPDAAGVRGCIEKIIEISETQAENIQKDITTTIESAKKSCTTCLEETLASLEASLEKIGNDLKTCASA